MAENSGSDQVREAAVAAARNAFAAGGFARTTFKGLAAAAGVAPSVLRKYYDNKEAVFAAALKLPTDPSSAVPAILGPGLDGLGERLVRATLDILEDPQVREDLVSMARAGASTAALTRSMQGYLEVAVIDRVVAAIGVPDARMRAALISSYLMGIAAGRYVARIEPLASASEEHVVRMVAPTVQALLDPRVPLAPAKG
ncbi:MAG: TetR family transcriptional regulator [Candidatus Nanopelagicales bacterium]|jgi:AcrR family transcriptional regulator